MSIADKITSIETHLSSDYEGLENIGADLTGINKNIYNIRTILDTIYNDLPKVTGEGTEVTLSPTRKGRLALIPKGNSTQESTNGYQLFNFTNIYTQGANIIAPTINNGIIHVQGENNSGYSDLNYRNGYFTCTDVDPNVIETNVRYYVSAKIEILQNPRNISQFQVLIGGHGELQCLISLSQVTGRYEGSFVATERTYLDRHFIEFRVGSCELNVSEIMISSTQNANYEQYTGGILAPNPSYPFSIKSVTGNNNVVVANKNLFNSLIEIGAINGNTGEPVNNGTRVRTQSFIKTNVAEQTLSLQNNEYNLLVYVYCYDENKTYLGYIGSNWNNIPYTFTPLVNTKYIKMAFKKTDDTEFYEQPEISNINNNSKPQLEYGSTATDYVPYQNQTLPLNLGTKKVMLGDSMQDDGIHHFRKQSILGNVTAVSTGTLFGVSVKYVVYRFPDEMVNHNTREYTFFCNKVSKANEVANVYSGYTINSNFVVIVDDNDTVETVNEKLADAILEFDLATEETEALTSEQQAQYNEIQKMQGYNGTTIITSTYDSANAQMIISASALKGE